MLRKGIVPIDLWAKQRSRTYTPRYEDKPEDRAWAPKDRGEPDEKTAVKREVLEVEKKENEDE